MLIVGAKCYIKIPRAPIRNSSNGIGSHSGNENVLYSDSKCEILQRWLSWNYNSDFSEPTYVCRRLSKLGPRIMCYIETMPIPPVCRNSPKRKEVPEEMYNIQADNRFRSDVWENKVNSWHAVNAVIQQPKRRDTQSEYWTLENNIKSVSLSQDGN